VFAEEEWLETGEGERGDTIVVNTITLFEVMSTPLSPPRFFIWTIPCIVALYMDYTKTEQ
jgi:hypothetical protein